LLGPGFVVGIGNGLLIGYLMYRSKLVPKRMAMLLLIAGPLIIISGIAVMFGIAKQGGPREPDSGGDCSVGESSSTVDELFDHE